MGVRDVVSTWSFLASKCKRITAIDCALMDEGRLVIAHKAAKEVGIDFEFVLGDTRELEIEPCDLLFIDTLHTYVQLVKELELHGNKSRKYIIFHDTKTFGHRDELQCTHCTGRGPGLQPAIDEFLEANYHWKVLEVFTHNNGLTVLERRGEAPMISVL